MKRKRTNLRSLFVFIIIIGAIPYSYFHSKDIYTFFMRTYYEKIRGQSIGQLLQDGLKMYGNREYEKLKDYLKTLVLIYPDNKELRYLEGLNFIKLGQGRIGTDIILSAAAGGNIPVSILNETVPALYGLKQYTDIITTMKKNNAGDNSVLLYYYGSSLVKMGQNREAIPVLKQALAGGRTGYEVYLEIGIAYAATGETRAALPYLERAHRLNENDSEANRALADAYRKLGRYGDAEKTLLRNRR